ncbi:MAG: hypothetical protein ACXWRA_16490 [Pseudobdellovibrionaceae bacterium]
MTEDLDQLIKEFQQIAPSTEQLLNWSLAAQKTKLRKRSRLQIGASIAAGLALGILLSRNYFTTQQASPIEKFVATYTEVTVKDM